MCNLHGADTYDLRYGAEAVATQRVGGQIESISWNTADGFAAALNAFIAQNYGAGKNDRVKKGYKASLWTVGIWGLLISAVFICIRIGARIFFMNPKQSQHQLNI